MGQVDCAGRLFRIVREETGAAGKGDAADAVLAGGLEEVVCADDVAVKDFLPGRGAGGIAGQVDDGVHVPCGPGKGVEIGQLSDDGVVQIGHWNAVEAAQGVAVAQAVDHD